MFYIKRIYPYVNKMNVLLGQAADLSKLGISEMVISQIKKFKIALIIWILFIVIVSIVSKSLR